MKKRTAMASPIYTGGPAIRLCWRPTRCSGQKPSAPRRWRSSRRGPRFGQRLFAILFQGCARLAEFRHFRHPSRPL